MEHIPIEGTSGLKIAYEEAGSGRAVVLLHGLTATHRYVVMGSRVLERSGYRVVAYDARGHGESTPAQIESAYSYEDLAQDLDAVLDYLGIEQAVLVGASMGGHTAVRFALAHPERVRSLVLVTPAFDPDLPLSPERLSGWDALAEGLRNGGVEGFLAAYQNRLAGLPQQWQKTVATVVRQRLSRHRYPLAVADALQVVPRSRPFESWNELAALKVPVTVVGSRDTADPEHPLAVAERYVQELPNAKLVVEDEGTSPLAWQGAQLAKVIVAVASEAEQRS